MSLTFPKFLTSSFLTLMLASQSALAGDQSTFALFDENAPQKYAAISQDEQGNVGNAAGSDVIYVIDQSLPDFLRQAARRTGYQISLTSKVRGNLKKMTLPMDMQAILEQIASQYDLIWHFQQQQLYVSVGSENSSRLIYLGRMSIENLESALSSAGIRANITDLTYVEESNSVIVNGPVSYIASVELIAESYNKNKNNKKNGVKVIRFGTVTEN